MQTNAFREYLLARYKGSSSYSYPFDILSRCMRVEDELGVNLDNFDADGLKTLHDDAKQVSKSESEAYSLVSALNRYGEFLKSKE